MRIVSVTPTLLWKCIDRVSLPPVAEPDWEQRAVAGGAPATPFRLSRSHAHYLDDIARCKQDLVDGESYEICLTNKVVADVRPDPLPLYRTLRRVNPAPFSAFLRFGETAVLCSSPERFLSIGRDRWADSEVTTQVGQVAGPDRDDLKRTLALRILRGAMAEAALALAEADNDTATRRHIDALVDSILTGVTAHLHSNPS